MDKLIVALANVLGHASNEIVSKSIIPQEFCNQVRILKFRHYLGYQIENL